MLRICKRKIRWSCAFYNLSGGWHCEHSSLSHIITSLNWSRKYILSSLLNWSLFRINLMFSLLKSCHNLGKRVRGCLSSETSLANGTSIFSLFLRFMWNSSALLSLFRDQVFANEDGRNSWIYCCINWRAKKFTRDSTGRIFESLNLADNLLWARWLT